jgi:hypothetical protein
VLKENKKTGQKEKERHLNEKQRRKKKQDFNQEEYRIFRNQNKAKRMGQSGAKALEIRWPVESTMKTLTLNMREG